MSRTYHQGERHIRVRGVRRDATDLRKLARALIELAQAQTEAEAQAEHAQLPRAKAKGAEADEARKRKAA
jgi:hypothetical protein